MSTVLAQTVVPETQPFSASISTAALEELNSRLQYARYPSMQPVPGWAQGVPLSRLRSVVHHWQDQYDMTRLPRFLNQFPQFLTNISGHNIHYWHVRSSRPDATPILLIHGWPGSVLEFRHVIAPLSEPNDPNADAFHLIIPSLPGYAYSEEPPFGSYSYTAIASVFDELMIHLGYASAPAGYIAQGGDWGADIVATMGRMGCTGLRGVHMNTAFFDVRKEIKRSQALGLGLTEAEKTALHKQEIWESQEDAYFRQQGTRPQTLGYGLSDSPVGLAAWLYEKMVVWSHHEGDLQSGDDLKSCLDIDEMLDNVMLYWVTNTATSSSRIYWESKQDSTAERIDKSIAVGVSIFPADLSWADRRWGERYYERLVRWKEMAIGGHFGAWEQPRMFVEEMREFVRLL